MTTGTNVPYIFGGFLYKEYVNELIMRRTMCPTARFTSRINNNARRQDVWEHGDIAPLIFKLAVD